MSISLTCNGCHDPNLKREDFYWSKKDPTLKTQRQCKKCVWKKRHPEDNGMFNINEFKKYYAY